jgi:hypothetical protein
MSGYSGTGELVATVNVYFVNDISGTKRYYLGGNPGLNEALNSAKSIAFDSTGAAASWINIGSYATSSNVGGYNQAIIELPGQPVESVDALTYSSIERFHVSVTNGAAFVLDMSGTDRTFDATITTDPLDFIYLWNNDTTGTVSDRDADGQVDTNYNPFGTTPVLSNGDKTLTTDTNHGLTTGDYVFYVAVDIEGQSPKTKTLTEDTFVLERAAGTGEITISFDGTDQAGVLTAAAPTRFDLVALESVIRSDSVDVTQDFKIGTGQEDLYYNYGKIVGTMDSAYTYTVTLHYWEHSGTGDYFAANSYVTGVDDYLDDFGGVYANIPVYRNEAGTKSYRLRSCLDFRPKITELTDTQFPTPSSSLSADYHYYLPRWDKIWINKDGTLGVTEGVAEESPRLPPEKSGTLTLFLAYVAPYVFGPNGQVNAALGPDQVSIRVLEYNSYTMSDISKIEQRISGLEAYVSESQLELDSYSDTILDSDGLPRSKNGIFVDRFTDHSRGEVEDPAYRCSMKKTSGLLHSPYEMNHVAFEYDTGTPVGGSQTNVHEWDNTITLGYTQQEYISQDLASEWTNINPFAVTVWAGECKMTPASDTWVDTRYLPAMQIQDPESARRLSRLYERTDAGVPEWDAWTSTIIGEDQQQTKFQNGRWRERRDWTNPGGQFLYLDEESTVTVTEQRTREGTILERTGSDIITKETGERTVDISSVYWMREADIEFEAFGLRPETTMVPYFANQNVAANVTWDAGNPSGLTTKAGYIKGTFSIPAQTFRTGKAVFSLKDAAIDPLSLASTEFVSAGTLITKQDTYISVEVPVYTTRAIFEIEETSQTFTTVSPRNARPKRQGDSEPTSQPAPRSDTKWRDPLAQTFLVEDAGGVFLESVDIFFQSKDRYLPVTLYVVETTAGIPGQKILPFGSVTKNPADVIAAKWDDDNTQFVYNGIHYDANDTAEYNAANNDTAVTDSDRLAQAVSWTTADTDFIATRFTFSDPVYLRENTEYAFVLVSNSSNYHVYNSRVGGYNIIDGSGIAKQPYLGSMLKSQNSSTWTPDQMADIKFAINRCDFDTSSSTLYMRTKGVADYWASGSYSIGDKVVYHPSNNNTNALRLYQCIAPATTENPDDTAKWSDIGGGEYSATQMNVSMDDMSVTGTYISRQWLFNGDSPATWYDFSNKQDITFTTKRDVELFVEGTGDGTSGTDPEVLDLKVTLSSDSTKRSPVINKNRTSAILVNNLVVTPGADAPAGVTYDAGEYISETTYLKSPGGSLKVLLDIAKPNANARVDVKYRIDAEDLRYVTAESGFSVDGRLKDQFSTVYWLDADLSTGSGSPIPAADWQERSEAIVDGVSSSDGFVYLSSIGNSADFAALNTILGGGRTNPHILITPEPGIASTEVYVWLSGTSFAAGDYAIHPTSKKLFKSTIGANTTEPVVNALYWEEIEATFVEGSVQIDSDTVWRPMTQINTVSALVDTTQHVEYEFEPSVSPSEDFDNFAIKVEMYSDDEVNVPTCKRLRAIAVT